MLIVIDTNVIVSALLKPGSVPDLALEAIWECGRALYDLRMRDEYRGVLARPKFAAIGGQRIERFFERLASNGAGQSDTARWHGAMKDEDDRIFVEVALAGRADAIVTGNIADYPMDLGVEILPPATLLAQLKPQHR